MDHKLQKMEYKECAIYIEVKMEHIITNKENEECVNSDDHNHLKIIKVLHLTTI